VTTVLGLDPGTATTGYGVIGASNDGRELDMVTCGTVKTPADMDFPERLDAIFDSIQTLVEKYEPATVAVEELYFSKNVKTAIDVGHARGVIVLATARTDVPMVEYNPTEIKKTLTGQGNADKKAVQKMVKQELELPEVPSPNDAADALAIAICHVLIDRYKSKLPDS
jgi:crossover junction endodeoxyribonuclease RuvC